MTINETGAGHDAEAPNIHFVTSWRQALTGRPFDRIVLPREPQMPEEHEYVRDVLRTRLVPGGVVVVSPHGTVLATTDDTRAAIAEILRDTTYVCSRVWDAWLYGTMDHDDFAPAWEDDALLDALTAHVAAAVEGKDAEIARLTREVEVRTLNAIGFKNDRDAATAATQAKDEASPGRFFCTCGHPGLGCYCRSGA